MARFGTDGKLGVALWAASSAANHRPGEKALADDNAEIVYVIAGETLSLSAEVDVNADWTASAEMGGGFVALSSATQGEYLWVRASAAGM